MRSQRLRRTIRPASVIAIGALAVGLSACTGTSGNADSVTVALSGDPGSLDPTQIYGQAPLEFLPYFYDTLLTIPQGGAATGLVAESWESSTTEATFTLRDDVTCADGAPLTVDDVKASFEYVENPDTAAYQFGSFVPAAGLAIATDEAARTITLTTRGGPVSFLAENLGLVPLICATGLSDPSVLATEPHGTGPYTLESSTAGQTYSLKLRDDYTWGIKPTNYAGSAPAEITVNVADSDATRANLLVSGQAQIGLVSGGDRGRIDASSPETALELPLNAYGMVSNETPGRPMADVQVRQAIAHAIDREAVNSVASEGKGNTIATISPGAPMCQSSDSAAAVLDFDASVAADMLDAAGWVSSADGVRTKDGQSLRVTLLFGSEGGASVSAAMELMQTQLKSVGVDAVLSSTAEWVNTVTTGGDWDMVWFPLAGGFPTAWYNFFTAAPMPEGIGWTHIANADYAAIGAEANKVVGEDSCDLWVQAQDALFRDADVIPIGTSTRTWYGTNVTFDTSLFVAQPSTIRVGG